MQNVVLLSAVTLWVYALINPQLGAIAFLFWLLAFILISITWSNRYAILSLIAAASYHLSDWSHLNPFYSKVFPIICGISLFIVFFALLFKLLENVKGSGGSGYMGSGGSDVGGIGGGCDGGGCGGGD